MDNNAAVAREIEATLGQFAMQVCMANATIMALRRENEQLKQAIAAAGNDEKPDPVREMMESR
ncbi:hypothetical protein FB480_101830 [Agrobacterium vitis]|nr:hypothetical protein FB480_101830 [Agrobacterium vitis]